MTLSWQDIPLPMMGTSSLQRVLLHIGSHSKGVCYGLDLPPTQDAIVEKVGLVTGMPTSPNFLLLFVILAADEESAPK